MEQQVDFYIVRNTDPDAHLLTACRLAEKAFGVCQRIQVMIKTADDARKIDDLLWTYRQDSFIPHTILSDSAGDEPFANVPMHITVDQQSLPACDVLINLSERVPLNADSCPRIVEVVANAPASVAAGRERYRVYRDLGCRLKSHNV